MRIKVNTESGSFYHIDTETGHWQRNGSLYSTYHMISSLRVGDYEDRRYGAYEKGTSGSWHDAELPEVGKCMYIHAKGLRDYWVSTPVIGIEEDPSDWPDDLDWQNSREEER